jgi:hypothetical protein
LLGQNRVVVATIVLAALVLTAGLSGRLGLGGAVALSVVSVLWFVVNGPMEGPVLVGLWSSHGITGGDLAGVVGLGLAAFRGARAYRQQERV